MYISEVSKELKISTHTLRYYEKIGLIKDINRDISGNRVYYEKDVKWIKFLLRLKKLKMPIKKIKLYSELRYKSDETISERSKLLEEQKKQLLSQVEEIENSIKFLDEKIQIYKIMGRRNQNE